MHFSTLANGFVALSTILLGASAIPQPDLVLRQQAPASSSNNSKFTSAIRTQCYTSRASTQLNRAPTTTSSTTYTSVPSTTTTHTTITRTPAPRTITTTSTTNITNTVTNYNGTIVTRTKTNTRLMTTTSFVTRTTGTTTTSTISETSTTTIPASQGFSPVRSTLPSPAAVLQNRHTHPLIRRQRGGPRGGVNGAGRPRGSFGRNRPRSFPGDVSCLALYATGTVSTRTQTRTITLQSSTVTSTMNMTATIRATVVSPAPTAQSTSLSTTTVQTTITSMFTFTRTTVQTTTDTQNSTSTATTSIYAACTDPANHLSQSPASNSSSNSNSTGNPFTGVTYDSSLATFDVGNISVYDCCVSSVMNPLGAIWLWSVQYGCFSLVAKRTGGTEDMPMCTGGQGGQEMKNETVLTGMMGAMEDYTVGNGYCGGWNMVMVDQS